MLVGIAQEHFGLHARRAPFPVSIRVLVGIAQERFTWMPIRRPRRGFNPCVGRNSSGAAGPAGAAGHRLPVSIRVLVGIAQELGKLGAVLAEDAVFQSVCWSE